MIYEPVMGLEVHAQLRTQTKLFCGCKTTFGAQPNLHTCPVCLGLPGALPVVNRRAVELAVRAALALGCTVHERSQWARKNYFYPDLPKGYQISQYDRPLATGGALTIDTASGPKRVSLTRMHMEEDAGKSVHDDPQAHGRSYVDFNRGGTPLVEIVSEPELHSAEEAATYMKALRQVLRYLEVCDGNMEEGSLRCDANVSLRPVGTQALGVRTELKNINSFRFVQQALAYEIARQTAVLESGGTVVQETRLWDSDKKVTRAMRGKEEAHDYRYFPDPDLPELILPAHLLTRVRAELPELPFAKRGRYVAALGLSDYDAALLTEDATLARFFEAALARHTNAKGIANWVTSELLRELKDRDIATLPFSGEAVGVLVALIDDGTISGKIAKDVFAEMLVTGGDPAAIVEAKGLRQVSDTGALEAAIDAVMTQQPDSVTSYRAGNEKVLGFLVGQVMKATGGKANPKLVNELLRRKLR
ncbi:MAG: Asp-tRNA(Asn)/Glu-tRNA(Gln) amidotransferase subunit GatB [Myxococcota bacterium]